MQPITLTNSQKRTAELLLVSTTPPKEIKRVVDRDGQRYEPEAQAIIARIQWTNGKPPAEISDALIKGDPEIDFDLIGRPMTPKCRVYVDAKGQVTHNFNLLEEKLSPTGEVKGTSPFRVKESNLDHPLPFSGKFVPVHEAVQKFVFHRCYQVLHRDGLTYDFLMALCAEIQPKGLLMVRAGLKGNEPLIIKRGGLQAQGFLWGRVQEKKYSCCLFLTFQEMKLPAVPGSVGPASIPIPNPKAASSPTKLAAMGARPLFD